MERTSNSPIENTCSAQDTSAESTSAGIKHKESTELAFAEITFRRLLSIQW